MVEDLLFLRSVLADAGISYLLVRGNDDRPVVAVDWKDRKELRDALVEACRDEPFYSMSVDAKKKSSVLVADGELSPNRQARIFRLYRPRVEPEGGLEFGASAGVQLELWSFEGDQLILPIENSLTAAHHAGPGRGARHRGTLRPHLAHHREHVRRTMPATSASTSTWCSPGLTAARPSTSRPGARAWPE